MKKILGSALVIGVLAYGLSGNGQIFANNTKTDDIQKANMNYSIEKLDQNTTTTDEGQSNQGNANTPDESKFNQGNEDYRDDNYYGDYHYRGSCHDRGQYRQNRSNSNGMNYDMNYNMNYSNMQTQ